MKKNLTYVCILLFVHSKIAANDVKNIEEEVLSPIVNISSGSIRGHVLHTDIQNRPYFAFQGIPYAKPPTGKLRFKAPQPVEPWKGILNATKDGASCYGEQLSMDMSEDCLFINVFTPNLTGKLPVMFWIYGGGFAMGNANFNTYGPDYLINEDVVVVSFNYRVQIFGFLSTNDEVIPGNFGLKDQILALKWVQQNIDKFGGNPEEVTIFGQSAGAASVAYLLQTPLTKGLYKRAIMESGTSLNLWARSSHPQDVSSALATTLNITYSNSEDLLTQLQELDAEKIFQAAILSNMWVMVFQKNPFDGFIVAPSIEPEHEGAVITEYSHKRLKEGNFEKVPLIVGYTSEEAACLFYVVEILRAYLVSYDLQPLRLVPENMNVENTTDIHKIVASLSVKTHYFGILPVLFAQNSLIKYLTDDQFIRPITEYVRLVSDLTPTYFYRFSYEGQLPNVPRPMPGATHTEENYYILKNIEKNNASESDLVTRKRLVKLWTNFAKYSMPTPEVDPLLQNLTWQKTNPETLNFLDIDNDLTMSDHPRKESIEFWDDIYSKFGKPPYDTY